MKFVHAYTQVRIQNIQIKISMCSHLGISPSRLSSSMKSYTYETPSFWFQLFPLKYTWARMCKLMSIVISIYSRPGISRQKPESSTLRNESFRNHKLAITRYWRSHATRMNTSRTRYTRLSRHNASRATDECTSPATHMNTSRTPYTRL